MTTKTKPTKTKSKAAPKPAPVTLAYSAPQAPAAPDGHVFLLLTRHVKGLGKHGEIIPVPADDADALLETSATTPTLAQIARALG